MVGAAVLGATGREDWAGWDFRGRLSSLRKQRESSRNFLEKIGREATELGGGDAVLREEVGRCERPRGGSDRRELVLLLRG